MTLKELREKLAATAREIRVLADKIKTEKRDFTADEKTRWDALNRDFDALGRQVEVSRRADDVDAAVGARPDNFGGRPLPGREDYDSRAGARDDDRRGFGGPAFIPGSGGEDVDNGEARPLRRNESAVEYLRTRRDRPSFDSAVARLGFGGYVRAMALGPRNDLERRALSEGSGPAGGYTVPEALSARLIDRMRSKATVIRAGAQVVPLTSNRNTFARVATDPTPAWRGENASVAEAEPTFESIALAPKSLGMIVKVSRELLADSINIEQALETVFANSMALELDRVSLLGAGAAQPLGIFNFPNVNSVEMAANGAAITSYDKVIDLLLELANDNAATPTAAIMAPRTFYTLAKLKDQEDRPLEVPPALRNIPFMETTQIPVNQTQGSASNASSIIVGDFNDLWIGVRTSMQVEILKERYADNLQYGFLVWMRADIHAAHDESFGKLIGIIP